MTVEDKIKALMPDGVKGYIKGLGWVTCNGYGGHGVGDNRVRYTYAYAMELPENVCVECGVATPEYAGSSHTLACPVYAAWLNDDA